MGKITRQIVVTLIIVEIFLYEWSLFAIPSLSFFVNFCKIFIPILLLLIAVTLKKGTLSRYFWLYVFTYFLFGIFVLFATTNSSNLSQSFDQYLKIIPPRLVFIISIGVILYRYPRLIISINKLIFGIAILVFIQYIALVLYSYLSPFIAMTGSLADRGTSFAGPFGLLGSVNHVGGFNNLALLRLTSFWYEPSNASGFMFSSFFIGMYLKKTKAIKIRKIIYFFPLIGGFFALSNAGYLAITSAAVIWTIYSGKNKLFTIFKVTPLLLIIIIGLNGRSIVAKYYPDNIYLRTLVGVTRISETHKIDYTYGRLGRYKLSYTTALKNPFGIGFLVPGIAKNGKSDKKASASALFYLLKYTGFFGLACILILKLFVLRPVLSYNNRNKKLHPEFIFLLCAWIAISVQNLIYGTWMSLYYYYLSVVIITSFLLWDSQKRGNACPTDQSRLQVSV